MRRAFVWLAMAWRDFRDDEGEPFAVTVLRVVAVMMFYFAATVWFTQELWR